jgi:hypothetical protein
VGTQSTLQKMRSLNEAQNVLKTLKSLQKLRVEKDATVIEQYSDTEQEFDRNLKEELHSQEMKTWIRIPPQRLHHQGESVNQIIKLHDDLLTNIVQLKHDAGSKPQGKPQGKLLKQYLNHFESVKQLGSWFLYFDSLITAGISKEDLKIELKKRVPHEGYQSEGVLLNDRDPQLWKKILNGLTSTEIIDLFQDKPTNALLVPIQERYFGIIPQLLGRLGDLYNPKTHAKCIIDLMTKIHEGTNRQVFKPLLEDYVRTAIDVNLRTSLENNSLADLISEPQKFINQKETFKKLYAFEQLIQSDLPDLRDYDFVNDFDDKFNRKLASLRTRLLESEAKTDTDHLKTLKKFYQNYELSPDIISLMQEPLKTFERMDLLNNLKNRLDSQDSSLKEASLSFAQELLKYKPTSFSVVGNKRPLEDFIYNAEPEILGTSLKTGQIKSLFTMDDHSYRVKKNLANEYHRLIEILEYKGDLDKLETTTTYNFLDESRIQKQKEKILELLRSRENPEDSTTLKVFRQIMKAKILTPEEIIEKYLKYPRLKEVIKVLDQFLKDLKGFDTNSSESQELISEFIQRVKTYGAKPDGQQIMTGNQKNAASRFLQSNSRVAFENLIDQLNTGSPPYSNLFQKTQYVLSMLNIAKKTLEKTSNIGLDFDPKGKTQTRIDTIVTQISKDTSSFSQERDPRKIPEEFTQYLESIKSEMLTILEEYNESINRYNANPQNRQQDLMVFPEERESLSEAARNAAIEVADNALNDSAAFWNLAQAARTYRANPVTAANTDPNTPTDFRSRLESIIQQQEESLLLEMFKWCARDIQIFNTSSPNQYPGPGFVVKGINIPRALGIENENPKEYIRSLERDILPDSTNDRTVGMSIPPNIKHLNYLL